MKKYLYILMLLSFAGIGCQELDLEMNPMTTKEQLEKRYDGVKGMLTSLYTNLPDGLFYIDGGTGAALMAAATDEAEYTYEGNPVQSFNTGAWNKINNPDMVWGDYYRGIRKVNQFLLSRDKVDLSYWKLDPSASAQSIYIQYQAEIIRWGYEARFLRAFFYFELVKRYGGVPLIHNIFSLDDDFSQIKRNTLQECFDFIVSECDSSAANLPLNAATYPYTLANDLGRVTKLAALGLKSKVLLYAASELFNNPSWSGSGAEIELISLPTGNRDYRWRAASDAAKVVINAAGNVNLGNYKNLFSYNSYNSDEVLLCRRYDSSNDFERFNSPIGFPRGQSGNTPSQNLVDAYDVLVSGVVKNFDWNDTSMAAAPYANRDPRMAMSIVTNNALIGPIKKRIEVWNGGLNAKPIANATKTGYYLGKYVNQDLDLNKGNTSVHSWIILRLPEIYLNYAEALNEWAPTNADIKIYYDKVRSRTGVGMPGLSSGLSQTEVREKIRNEHRVEFAFEDHRFWDVKRWMIAQETLGKPLRAVEVTKAGNSYTYRPFVLENRVFEPKMYLYPIPQSDININGNLVQNPLW